MELYIRNRIYNLKEKLYDIEETMHTEELNFEQYVMLKAKKQELQVRLSEIETIPLINKAFTFQN